MSRETVETEQQPLTGEREKAVAFIVIRLSSSRFFSKQTRLIGERSLISHIIQELKRAREIDEIVITTVAEETNRPLIQIAEEENVSLYWYEGEINHVTTRLATAATAFEADICILVSGDCPLPSAPVLDSVIEQLRQAPGKDVVQINAPPAGNITAIPGIFVSRTRAWQLADQLSTSPELKEHHFPVIGRHPEKFSFLQLDHPQDYWYPGLRLSVDTYADLLFFRQLHKLLAKNRQPFRLAGALDLIRSHPSLVQLNGHVYQRGLYDSPRHLLYFIDSGSGYGYGHLGRSVEIGLQIIEWLGWSLCFVTDDIKAMEALQERGIRCVWGAFHRPPAGPRPSAEIPELNAEVFAKADGIVIDIAKRTVPMDWRNDDFQRPCIVIDKADPWVEQADAVIIPGVTADPAEMDALAAKGVPTYFGKDYIVIRREVQAELTGHQEKSQDVLCYTTDEQLGKQFLNDAQNYGIRGTRVNGTAPDFTEKLAAARQYWGRFGTSFYESLHLGTYPVQIVFSEDEREAAATFYKAFDIAPSHYLPQEIGELCASFNRENCIQIPPRTVEDMTANVVKVIQQIVVQET